MPSKALAIHKWAISFTVPAATWEAKDTTATNTRQYERGMPYLFFVKSETKPVHTEIRVYKDGKDGSKIFTDEDSPREIHDTNGRNLGSLPCWCHHLIVVGIIVCIEALWHWTNVVDIYFKIVINEEDYREVFFLTKTYTLYRFR